MTKKNYILLSVFVVLAAFAGYLYYNKLTSESSDFQDPFLAERSFAFKAFDKIAYISLKRPKYPTLVFKRNGKKWRINEKWDANEQTMNGLIQVLSRMEMKYIPPKSMLKTIQEDIKKNGIEIKLYSDSSKMEKHYFVGSEFGDGTDTPVIMANGKQPFMMELKGLDGSIRRRMNFDLPEWRTKMIFSENPDKLKKITIEYPQDPSSGFTLLRFNNEFKVLDFEGKEVVIKNPNANTISAYFDFYSNIGGESNETENPERRNIIRNPAFAVIKLVSVDNMERKYSFYAAMDIVSDVKTLSPNSIHPDNRYFVATHDNNFVMGQQRVLGKLFKSIWYFF
jgi:hypothetical protein